MEAFHAGRASGPMPPAVWLLGAAGLLAITLTVALVWAVLTDPLAVIEAIQPVLRAR